MKKQGVVILAGAGPGDPGLATVALMAELGRCDVVVYDYLANVALLKSLALSDLTLVAGNSATLDNVAGYVFEAATSGTNKGTLHLIVDKNAAIGTGNVSLVQIDIVLGANSTGFAVTDLITTTASKPVI